MKKTDILIISDVHGRNDLVCELLSANRNCDGVVFLGDGVRDIPSEEICRLYETGRFFAGVKGNCDPVFLRNTEYEYSDELTLRIAEYTVVMMHGHLHGVKSGIERAAAYAAQKGADVLLFGHTHAPTERYFPEGTELFGYTLTKPLWVFNPGSLASSNGVHSYGRMSVSGGSLLFSHGEIK